MPEINVEAARQALTRWERAHAPMKAPLTRGDLVVFIDRFLQALATPLARAESAASSTHVRYDIADLIPPPPPADDRKAMQMTGSGVHAEPVEEQASKAERRQGVNPHAVRRSSERRRAVGVGMRATRWPPASGASGRRRDRRRKG